MTLKEWCDEGVRRFGPDQMKWRFVCPSCGYVATVQQWFDAGASESAAFSCVGRSLKESKEIGQKPGPCNYAGGGLFKLNPVEVINDTGEAFRVFAFAELS